MELINSSRGDIAPITEINNLRTNLLPTYFLSFRDAVTAKKISQYLVPRHPNGSKAQVGIIYGAMHSGIETKLKHPWIADATIGLYHDLLGIGDNDFLNQVIKVTETGSMVYHDCGLFK